MGLLDIFKTTEKPSKATDKPSNVINESSKCSFFQPDHRAGLHFTTEWKEARDACKAKVDAISKQCRAQNRRFRDIEFDLENNRNQCLYGLETDQSVYNPTDVLRVTQIFEKPQFFIGGAKSNDIVQGALGNCWFLSALAIMSAKEGLVENFCVARDEKIGIYGFVFFRDLVPVSVIIDDLLYISIPKWEELGYEQQLIYHRDQDLFNKLARKGGKTLYFAKSGTENVTWVALVEKAYAKLHGDYASLSGGYTGEAIEDMTGGLTSFITTKDIFDPDIFWENELLKDNQDRLFGCWTSRLDSSRTGGDPSITIRGLIGGHAYSVIRALEYNGKRFVIVRNPWGSSEWTGPWSDGSKEWTKEWLPALEHLNHTFGDDGEFVMEYTDFLSQWEFVDRTLLFDDQWYMSSHWLKVTARSLLAAWTFGDVSFTIDIPAATYAVIVLSQLDDRYFKGVEGKATWHFDFVLFKKGETEPIGMSSSCGPSIMRSVNLEIDLPKGEYVVHVRLDRHFYSQDDKEAASKDWDKRKLARVLTERAKSQSIAANFKVKERAVNLPIPLETLAGQDLTELEQKAKEAAEEMRKKDEELRAAAKPATVKEGSGADAAAVATTAETREGFDRASQEPIHRC